MTYQHFCHGQLSQFLTSTIGSASRNSSTMKQQPTKQPHSHTNKQVTNHDRYRFWFHRSISHVPGILDPWALGLWQLAPLAPGLAPMSPSKSPQSNMLMFPNRLPSEIYHMISPITTVCKENKYWIHAIHCVLNNYLQSLLQSINKEKNPCSSTSIANASRFSNSYFYYWHFVG